MRGRRPRPLTLHSDDVAILQWLARCRSQPWFQVQHARILLGIAAGQRVKTPAREVQCDAATVWRVCRGYEQHGLDVVLWEAPRPGRPQQLSPPAACPDRAVGLSATHRQRVAHHALEQFRLGPPSCQRWHRRDHQPAVGATNLAWRRSAAAPHPVLEDESPRRGVQGTGRAGVVVLRKCPAFGRAGLWVVCVDEMPNLQILERHPIRRARPGRIEHQEFEYTRHGTVNLLLFLIVHSGRMELAVEPKKDAARYIGALRSFSPPASWLARGVLDPGRRSQSHGRRYHGILVGLPRLVAAPLYAGACLVARPGETAHRRIRPPLLEACLVA